MASKNDRPKFDAIIEVHDSQAITGLTYDPMKLILDVQFVRTGKDKGLVGQRGGAIYRYRNVSPLEFALMVASKSTGRQFNALVKGKKPCTKLRRTSL